MLGKAKKIVIVKKIRRRGERPFGGQWKVTYADFVTAMMAFFMVMWIIGMDQHTRELIEGYFANPAGFRKGFASGESPLSTGASPIGMRGAVVRVPSPAERGRRTEAERLASVGL